MLAQAGEPLGIRMRFLDPASDACAGEVGELVVGAYDDPRSLERLAEGTDVVTYEFENVSVAAARLVGAVPDPRALELGQDRLVEKELFHRLGIPTARFGSVEDVGVPALVKSRRMGYDGKGQHVVEAVGPIAEGELAEEIVAFERELSIVAVRGRNGETRFWPLAENEHRGGILAVSRAPAADAPQAAAEQIAGALLDELGYVGVIAVELFEVGGALLANEFAPRVHNTGHWTIDGAASSQFENHLRALLRMPLGPTEALGRSTMVNLVGSLPPLDALRAVPGARVHLYGKAPRPGRKLGHVTLVDATDDAVAEVTRLASDAWS
jgi:5-(carboxyamino)imidazole ribonucleotide synthase